MVGLLASLLLGDVHLVFVRIQIKAVRLMGAGLTDARSAKEYGPKDIRAEDKDFHHRGIRTNSPIHAGMGISPNYEINHSA